MKQLQLSDENSVILLLLEQKYLEFLKNEQVPEALNTVREEITPLGLDPRLLHKLASKILKPDPVGEEEDTEVVKKKLQELLPLGVIVPERRLEYLLDDDLDTQRGQCDFHNVQDSDLSLFSYHYCDKRKIPSETLQVLSEHTDEVWFLTFSHDGKCLASSSKDKTAILWEMDAEGKFTQKHKLVGHEKPVVAVLWSDEPFYLSEYDGHKRTRFIIRSCFGGYDEDFIASGSEDSQASKGLRPCRVLRGHSGAVNCVSWNPTDIHMLASGSDDRTIRIWGLAKK
ncbi:BnaC02g42630D [Brassica napus]|uniref:BnaC02g42630D protein n=2 Tax=Brassica napus TaxID=3708 RepID=A0A078HMV7_BRANA|nr:BnaC02g42630D [Brassica napus]